MLFKIRRDFRSGLAVMESSVGMCLAASLVLSGHAFAVEGGPQDGLVSSPRQPPSGQAVSERGTKATRTDAFWAPSADLGVQWEAGKLSLDVEGAPLSEVLRAVSHATGIRVTGAEGLSSRVSAHFIKMDLLPALTELLAGVDYAIAAGPAGSPSAQSTRVIILPRTADVEPPTSLLTAETNAPEPAEAVLQQSEVDVQEEPEVEPQESQLEALRATANEAAGVGSPTSLETAETNAPEPAEAVPQESEGDVPGEPKAETQERLMALEAAATDGDWDGVRNSLQDADPTIQSAAFETLAAHDKAVAVEELSANVQDASQPTRLQALALLVQSSGADEQIVMGALRDALHDPDPAFNDYAAQVLAGRDDADAMAALREGLHSPNPSTRLMILQSVVHTEAGLPLLHEALADSDETEGDALATLLQQAEAVTGTTSEP